MTDRETILREALADVLQIDAEQVSLTLTFSEQGVDSLTGLRFGRKVQDALELEIDPEWLLDYPSIRQLSEFLQVESAT